VWMARERNLRVSVRAPPTLQRALLRPRCRGCAAVRLCGNTVKELALM